jgi:hypothetical protein
MSRNLAAVILLGSKPNISRFISPECSSGFHATATALGLIIFSRTPFDVTIDFVPLFT